MKEAGLPGSVQDIPVWVYIVVSVVLPVVGWVSRDAKQRLEAKVQDTVSVRGTQNDIIRDLRQRVSDLEQRLDDKDKHYQGMLDDMERRYLQQIANLEQHIEALKAEIKGRRG